MEGQEVGIVSAVVASICCVGPLALILLGLGGLGLGAFFGQYHWVFIGAAAALLLASWGLYYREKQRCESEQCQMRNKKLSLITLIISTAAVIFFTGANLYTYASSAGIINSIEQPSEQTGMGMELSQTMIPVEGMTCFTCEISVEQAAKKLRGVQQADANVKTKSLTVDYDPGQVTIPEIVNEVNKTGYRAQLPESDNINNEGE